MVKISSGLWLLYSKLNQLDFYLYLRAFVLALLLDGLILDDEPLWEPLEWSVLQTWVLFIYVFSWGAEVIFSSKYGSYTNRDKIVWIGLFKTYWGLLLWFLVNIIIVTVFVTLPFYFEITYAISYSVVWWNWISSAFFFKLTTVFSLLLITLNILRFQARWSSHNTMQLTLLLVVCVLTYLTLFMFISTFFAPFTDSSEFQKSGWSQFSSIVNGPLKWGWGSDARDHFSYHKTPSVFWFKNDPLIASSLLFINIFVFLFIFFLLLQSIGILRLLVSTGELSHNNLTFLISSVKQYYYLMLSLLSLVVLSFIYQFMRFPFELAWFDKVVFVGKLEWLIVLDFLSSVRSFFL